MAVGDTYDLDQNGEPMAQPMMQSVQAQRPRRVPTPPQPSTPPAKPAAPAKPKAPSKPTAGFSYPNISMSVNRSLGSFSTGNAEYDSAIMEASRTYNLDPLLLVSQMRQESNFKERAVSNKGASGLMQLMPATARAMGVKDIFDVRQNIMAGGKYLRMQLDKFGTLPLALAAYNAGPGKVAKFKNQIPPYKETRNYVRNIMTSYQQKLTSIPTPQPRRSNASMSPRPQTFMEKVNQGVRQFMGLDEKQ